MDDLEDKLEAKVEDKDPILAVFLKEYDKLKSEQAQRIGFRDNLLYVTLGLFGTIISFVFSNSANYYALLIIPWICLILGWTYVVNDEKISAIGRYIRLKLADKIKLAASYGGEDLLGWETAHRDDKHRQRRKIEQLVIDQIAFVVSGLVAIALFWTTVPCPPLSIKVLSWVELVFLLVLGAEMLVYADLRKGS
jgi:hypothetical protein